MTSWSEKQTIGLLPERAAEVKKWRKGAAAGPEGRGRGLGQRRERASGAGRGVTGGGRGWGGAGGRGGAGAGQMGEDGLHGEGIVHGGEDAPIGPEVHAVLGERGGSNPVGATIARRLSSRPRGVQDRPDAGASGMVDSRRREGSDRRVTTVGEHRCVEAVETVVLEAAS